MLDALVTDYFYGDESQQFTYFRIPRLLITNPRFRHLSVEAKLLYSMMLDRMSLSVKNEWYDEDGRVYIYFTVGEICDDMNCGRDKAMKLLGELDTRRGIRAYFLTALFNAPVTIDPYYSAAVRHDYG